jgi:hypothetical protein
MLDAATQAHVHVCEIVDSKTARYEIYATIFYSFVYFCLLLYVLDIFHCDNNKFQVDRVYKVVMV